MNRVLHVTMPPQLQLVTEPAPATEQPPGDTAPRSEGDLYRRFAPYVARIGYRLLGREDEVDDLIQDVFLVAFKQRGQLRDPGALKGWLATIAVRTARRKLRLRKLKVMVGLDTPQALSLAQPGISPEEETLLHRIYALLDQVSVEQRLAWTLRHVEGERLERVAEKCDCSLATVKRRIAAAHSHLQAELNDG